MKKDSFVLYKSLYEPIKALSTEEKGVFLDAIFKYQLDGTIDNSMNPMVRMAFLFFKNQFDLDAKKYEDTCNKRAEIGRKGGLAKASKSYQKVAKGSKPSKSYHNDNDNDNDNEKDNDIKGDSSESPSSKKSDKEDLEETFEIFWNHYHKETGKPKEDKESAFKHWKKLSLTDRRKAYAKVVDYANSVNDKKFCKKARTYLADKSFNNEFIKQPSTPKSRTNAFGCSDFDLKEMFG